MNNDSVTNLEKKKQIQNKYKTKQKPRCKSTQLIFNRENCKCKHLNVESSNETHFKH